MTRVVWRRVALFYGIALAGPVAIALLVLATGQQWGAGPVTMLLGAVTMLVPLLAGWVTERVAGRPHLLTRGWAAFKTRPGIAIARIVGWAALVYAAVVAALFGVAALGSSFAVPGMGRWATPAEVGDAIAALAPVGSTTPPELALPVGVLVALAIGQGLLAGLTVNAVFAFGEEYGWRGVLAEELAPLGRVRATLLTGILWGLWHAPLIALGHNYGADWGWGVPLFCAITVPLAFLLTWVRERSGFVWSAAIVHGAFNGVAGIFMLVLVDAHRLVAPPVGLAAALALGVVAAALWAVPRRSGGQDQSARP